MNYEHLQFKNEFWKGVFFYHQKIQQNAKSIFELINIKKENVSEKKLVWEEKDVYFTMQNIQSGKRNVVYYINKCKPTSKIFIQNDWTSDLNTSASKTTITNIVKYSKVEEKSLILINYTKKQMKYIRINTGLTKYKNKEETWFIQHCIAVVSPRFLADSVFSPHKV